MGVTAIVSGTFDPVTTGHVDVISRAAKLFPRVVVAISVSHYKSARFSGEVRLNALKAAVCGLKNVEVALCEGLLADFCNQYESPVIVRGARNGGDFEYELEMFAINREVGALESVVLPADAALAHVSSSYARELIKYGRDFSRIVPPGAYEIIKKALENENG